MPILQGEMVRPCNDIDNVLQQICQRLRKLEKSDSEKTEEIGRLNRIINQKNVEIHNLKTELPIPKRVSVNWNHNWMKMTAVPLRRTSRKRTAAIAAFRHRRRALRRMSFAGQNLSANRAEDQAADSQATRVILCRQSLLRIGL